MQNIVYTSIPEIIQSCTSIKDQLAMIDMILMNMLVAINTATASVTFEEYSLDTGQTKNAVKYRSMSELQSAYRSMFETRRMVQSQLNINRQGRIVRLVDGRNFIG
jgi:hypothetical protein